MTRQRLVNLIRSCVADSLPGTSGITGICLSGGLDSSTVACLAPKSLPTFTGWYDVYGYDEREYARLAAHSQHHEVEITPRDFVTWFDVFARHVKGEWGTGAFGQFMVARAAAKRGIRILLSGEGSDELFGGYARQMIVAGEERPVGYENYVLPDEYPTDLAGALAYDYERLPALLAVDDAMCAAWSIEARAPLNDPRLHKYALALDPTERVNKRHLRAAVRGVVPDAIIDRTDKMGFPTPFVLWAQEPPVRTFVQSRIGYVPRADQPFARGWWYAMLEAAR